MQVVFRVTRGDGDLGYIAIDLIQISEGTCPEYDTIPGYLLDLWFLTKLSQIHEKHVMSCVLIFR